MYFAPQNLKTWLRVWYYKAHNIRLFCHNRPRTETVCCWSVNVSWWR